MIAGTINVVEPGNGEIGATPGVETPYAGGCPMMGGNGNFGSFGSSGNGDFGNFSSGGSGVGGCCG